uniref:Uncharacterized protein n=1 Tax=Arundo donax TaxID=35708 RepID=A0A0A9B5A6_ARUDO
MESVVGPAAFSGRDRD